MATPIGIDASSPKAKNIHCVRRSARMAALVSPRRICRIFSAWSLFTSKRRCCFGEGAEDEADTYDNKKESRQYGRQCGPVIGFLFGVIALRFLGHGFIEAWGSAVTR